MPFFSTIGTPTPHSQETDLGMNHEDRIWYDKFLNLSVIPMAQAEVDWLLQKSKIVIMDHGLDLQNINYV